MNFQSIGSAFSIAMAIVFANSVVVTGSAQESRAYLHSYNIPAHGVAIEGYSPVSYFTVGKAVRGSKEFAVNHNGVSYYLASADEKKKFVQSPDRYVPAYGGWCGFGMAVKDKFPIDPSNFKIVKGKLILFLKNENIDARKLWNKGVEEELLKKAGSHWEKVSS